MSQAQTNAARFAGPDMIHDRDHLSGIPPVQDANARQSEQGKSDRRQKGSKEQQGGDFEYHNPRQYS